MFVFRIRMTPLEILMIIYSTICISASAFLFVMLQDYSIYLSTEKILFSSIIIHLNL